MSDLKEQMGEKVHTRHIEIATYECKEGGIIVQAELKDNRLQPYYKFNGEKSSPHLVHHMIIRMHVYGPTLLIKAIEAEMPGIPREDCIQTRKSLDIVTGMSIAPGFTAKIKQTLGGANGCSHLTTLLLAMAPAAVQGYWAHFARKPLPKKLSPDIMNQYLIDTCWVWRKDGKLAKEFL
ncbi:MAG: DUF2889 domain-containing protein [Desulfobacteraceae bacterium]|nr:MAG: DUF2889 domain-containing protein [Desulfobacteraceae bacterium]